MSDSILIDMKQISPYIRYVNDELFKGPQIHVNRIIYDHELILCLQGEARMILDGNHYNLKKGDLFYIKPNVRNQMILDENKSIHVHCVHFDWVTIDEKFDFTAEKYYINGIFSSEEINFIEKLKQRPNYAVSEFYFPTLIHNVNLDKLQPLFKELYFRSHQPDITSKLMVKSLFLNIIASILDDRFTSNGAQRDHYHIKTIHHAIEYMKVHSANDLNTTNMSKYCGLSAKYFGALFKEVTGVSMNVYLLELRMQNAKRLLLTSDLTLEQLASEIGIHDVYYFTKLFKKVEGITPGKYRRMLSSQEPLP
jgi:YesN/AraC family two-component response regulator